MLAIGVAASGAGLISRAGAASLPGKRVVWPGGAAAAVSLTYDDGLDSQLANVLPALERFGFKATFFLVRENIEARVADWRAVGEAGHEIGDHTAHHLCQLSAVSTGPFDRQEIEDMEQFLASNFPKGRVPIFAYPCGVLDLGEGGVLEEQLRYIRLLRPYFAAARAADGEPNDPRLVPQRRYVLQASAPTYDRDDPQLAIDYVRSAIHRGHWAILIFHGVLEKRLGPGDTSIRHHDAILHRLASEPVWCAPMGAVLEHLGIVKPGGGREPG